MKPPPVSTDFLQAGLQHYQQGLSQLQASHRLRRLVSRLPWQSSAADGSPTLMTQRDDSARGLLSFSGNDYLGYAQHPALKAAALAAVAQEGVGAGASRLISGTTPRIQALETAVAQWKGTEAALVFPTGFSANVGVLQAVCGPGDGIVADKLNHASLVDGMRHCGAIWKRYAHKDLVAAERQLSALRPTVNNLWWVTDGVFSMDGDWVALPELLTLAQRYGAFVLLDDAHGSGVFGQATGAGLLQHYEISAKAHPWLLQVGTFSKALGSLGGFVAGSQVLVDWVINHARSFIYTTGLPPAVVAANQAAITLVQQDFTVRAQLWERVHLFYQQALGHEALCDRLPGRHQPSPIVPIQVGNEAVALHWQQSLMEAGFWVPAIRPPTVPSSRLRVSLSALHSPQAVVDLVEALAQLAVISP